MFCINRIVHRVRMATSKHTFNVIQLGIGFFFIFFAFNSQGFIEETVLNSHVGKGGISDHDGYTSLSIIYAVFTLANFFAAPIVAFLNARWSIVFGGITYGIFQFGFLFLNQYYLYISSALIGFGAAVIWTAQGKYLSLNSTEATAGKHSGLFWAISQACLVFGGIFLFIVFSITQDSEKINDKTVSILYGVFTATTALGVVILAFLRLPHSSAILSNSETAVGSVTIEKPVLSHVETLVSTLKLCVTRRMALMIWAFAYTGIELSFWSGIYPTCISSTLALGYNTKKLLALNAITQGLGQATSGLFFGILSSKTGRLGRDKIVFLGALVHLIAFTLIYINFPKNAPLGNTQDLGLIQPSISLALLCGFLLGFGIYLFINYLFFFGDACWNTQIFAFLITKYPNKSESAFSVFKFFQSLLSCAAFYYSKLIGLQWHTLILVIGSLIGCIVFFVAERLPVHLEEVVQTTADSSEEEQHSE